MYCQQVAQSIEQKTICITNIGVAMYLQMVTNNSEQRKQIITVIRSKVYKRHRRADQLNIYCLRLSHSSKRFISSTLVHDVHFSRALSVLSHTIASLFNEVHVR